MEIRSYLCCIIFNCVLLYPFITCKSVSLNDIIAAESQTSSLQKPQLKVSETKTNIRESPKRYQIFTITKNVTPGSVLQINKKISPLKYRRTFQIRTPLRPKKIKYSHRPRSRRINTATKREIDNDEKINRNYIPLLKSLNILFNNILRSDSESDDDTDEYYSKKHIISRSEECPCAYNSKYRNTNREPPQKTTTIASFIASTVPTKAKTIVLAETSSTSAHNTFDDNISTLRRNKNVPILSARDSVSSWRNHTGFGEGSLSPYYGNTERYFTGNNGSNENNYSGRKTKESYTENHKEYTNGSSGDDASCNGSCRGIGRNRHTTSTAANEALTAETIVGSNETFRNHRGDGSEFKGFDKFETRRNKTESRILLSQSSSRLRRFESQEETTEVLWQIESPKESSFDVTYNITRNQRFSHRDGAVASEDQEFRRANKKLTLDDLSAHLINASRLNLPQDKQKFVVIYDGYSIAKDVNGENKLSEKAYRIHS